MQKLKMFQLDQKTNKQTDKQKKVLTQGILT